MRDADAARAADDAIDDDDIVALVGKVNDYFRLLFLYLFLQCWDTASEQAVAELHDLVAADMLSLYGDKHLVRTSISNVCPLCSLRCSSPACLLTATTEQTFRSLFGSFKRAHFQVQSVWA